jgi:hypothetical protein
VVQVHRRGGMRDKVAFNAQRGCLRCTARQWEQRWLSPVEWDVIQRVWSD